MGGGKHREKGDWGGVKVITRMRCNLSRNLTMRKRALQLFEGTIHMCSGGRPIVAETMSKG